MIRRVKFHTNVAHELVNICGLRSKNNHSPLIFQARFFAKQFQITRAREYVQAIRRCSRNNDWKKANLLLQDSIETKRVSLQTFVAVMKICAQCYKYSELLRHFYSMEQHEIVPNLKLCNMAINACTKTKKWREALNIMKRMEEQWNIKPDVVSFSSAISACATCSEREQAFLLFNEMKHKQITPNVFTFGALMSACEKGGEWKRALNLLSVMETSNILPNTVIYLAAMSACGQGGEWWRTLALFKTMIRNGIKPNNSIFNTCINACSIDGHWKEAMAKFDEMSTYGLTPDLITFNSLMFALNNGDQQEQIPLLLETMTIKHGITPNTITFNIIINGCLKRAQWSEIDRYFDQMLQQQVRPDLSILNAYITSCTMQAKSSQLYELFVVSRDGDMFQKIDKYHFHSAISYFVESGETDRALHLFSLLERKSGKPPGIIVLSSIMRHLCSIDEHDKALEMFYSQLERGVDPDVMSFNIAISACRHLVTQSAGLTGHKLFQSMQTEYQLIPDEVTYNALIHVLEEDEMHEEAMKVLRHATSLVANSPQVDESLFPTQTASLKLMKGDQVGFIDLHDSNASVARTLLRCVIQDIRSMNEKTLLKTPPSLTIITGQGHHSESSAILPQEIRNLFTKELRIPISEVSNNPGRFIVNVIDIRIH